MLKPPEFPKEFLKHCPQVIEAKDWHTRLGVEASDQDLESYAECGFISAGSGMECESCKKFLTRPFCGHKVDEEFLPQIEEFYRQLDEYEKARKRQEKILLDNGAGI